MLVITRRAGERIVIGNDVQVVVTEIRRRTVRIGVLGSPELLILRGEVQEAIEAANRAALQSTLESDDDLEALFEPPATVERSRGNRASVRVVGPLTAQRHTEEAAK